MSTPTYLRPESIPEAFRMIQEHDGEVRFLAGGTDILVNRFQGNDGSSCLVDITQIGELKNIEVMDGVLFIGSLVTLSDLEKNEFVKKQFPALAEAAHAVASPVIRKTATLGGNLLCENRCIFYNQSSFWREAAGHCLKCDGDVCIATGGDKNCFSKFVSDTAAVLIALNASVEIVRKDGTEIIPADKLYTGNGLRPRVLDRDSLLVSVRLPLDNKFKTHFQKLRVREGVDFTSLTTAVSLDGLNNLTVVLCGVDPGPVVLRGTAAEKEKIIKDAVKKPRTVDNDLFSRKYRKEMIGVFLRRSYEKIGV